MSTLLILGSKPAPALPPPAAYDAIACANASGRSAANLGLVAPVFTVMSAILTSGHSAANDLAVQALAGLTTGTLYFHPRPAREGAPWRRALHRLKSRKMSASYFQQKVRAAGYRFERFVDRDYDRYRDLVIELCARDEDVARQIEQKGPSMGIMALCLGMESGNYQRFVLSGFSFEITHAYADNPVIAARGSPASKHTPTDLSVLACLVRTHGNVVTTETVVHARAGVPLLEPAGGPDDAGAADGMVAEAVA